MRRQPTYGVGDLAEGDVMRVGVLGPLQILDGAGTEVPLPAAKQRAVLAVLALEVGRVVSTDRIVDEVWGASPPATVSTALQVHISNLRRTLREAWGGEAIVTRPPGYLLDVAPDETDVGAFQNLLTRGLDDLAAGRAELAARQLREALALWRGPVLADVVLSGELARDVEQPGRRRFDALDGAAAAELALGRAEPLVPELEAALATEPLREALWGHLIVALYRTGRQADALRTFAQALYISAWLAYLTGDAAAARTHTEEDLALSLRRGDILAAVECLNNLTELAIDEDRPDDAAQHVVTLTGLADRLGTTVALRRAALARGAVAVLRGDAAAARTTPKPFGAAVISASAPRRRPPCAVSRRRQVSTATTAPAWCC